MSNKYELSVSRVKSFNYRGMRNLGTDLGFDVKKREEGFEVARSLMSEAADLVIEEDTNPEEHARGMARLAIVARFLEGEMVETLQKDVSNAALTEGLPRPQRQTREFVLSVAGDAARNLKERFIDSAPDTSVQGIEETKKEQSDQKNTGEESRKDKLSAPRQPNYADIEDVVKYMYEVGMVSPSHAAALLVTLGYVRLEGGITDKLQNDILRIRSDLRSRIAAYQVHRYSTLDPEALRILDAFITQSAIKPNLQLKLADTDKMIAVGSVLVSIHSQGEVRSMQQFDRPGKYDGMGTIINFEE